MTGATGGMPRIEIDGRDATADQLRAVALDAYGHFTAMQVRDRRARGLGLHLARLDAANRDLFGAGLDPALIRDRIRHALGGETRDASVRVYVRESPGGSSVMVTVRPPGGMPAAPMLRGITMQLLELKLAGCGLPSRRAPVHLPGLPSFAAAFVTNARGIAAVGQIDDLALLVDPELMRTLTQAYESAGWDDI